MLPLIIEFLLLKREAIGRFSVIFVVASAVAGSVAYSRRPSLAPARIIGGAAAISPGSGPWQRPSCTAFTVGGTKLAVNRAGAPSSPEVQSVRTMRSPPAQVDPISSAPAKPWQLRSSEPDVDGWRSDRKRSTLRFVGSGLRRRPGVDCGHARPAAASFDRGQHPGRELSAQGQASRRLAKNAGTGMNTAS